MKYVLLLLFLAFGQSVIAQQPSDNELIRQWKGLEDRERSEWIGKLAPETLHALKSEGDASLAVQAAFKLTSDALHRRRGNQQAFTDERRLSYFLGFLEGRANIEPPLWSKTFLSLRATTTQSLKAKGSLERSTRLGKLETPPIFKPIELMRSLSDIHATKDGERYEFEYGGKTFKLPPWMLAMSTAGLYEDIDCVLDGKFIYVSVGGSKSSDTHRVCCINTEKKMLIWQAETCSGFNGALYGRSDGYHKMQMFPSNRLFIFNASHVGFFIHGFDATNGDTIFQFSSMFSG
jgi:hypothetical protein